MFRDPFYFFLPIPRRTIDASAKNVSMVPEDRDHKPESRKRRVRKAEKRRAPRERIEERRMPGQRAAGQQQKSHCPWVYTQPHPSHRPGTSPFLHSTYTTPAQTWLAFKPFTQKSHLHLCLNLKKKGGERHVWYTWWQG